MERSEVDGNFSSLEESAHVKSKSTLEIILLELINSSTPIAKPEIANIQEKLTSFIDLRLEIVKLLTQLIKNSEISQSGDEDTKELFMKNVLIIIQTIANAALSSATATNDAAAKSEDADADNEDGENQHKNLLFDTPNQGQDQDDDSKLKLDGQQELEFKKRFSELWSQIIKWEPKPIAIHKQIISLLPDKIMPFLTKPLHMSDYLLSAFDLGGPMSLLSLHGIFILMLRYNFEITDFYKRLYSLFQPSIFHAKYKTRFFMYSSQFLASTHLPEALVGAFVKRLARLALLAPTPSLPLIFDFISNLMVQHPGLKSLVHKETNGDLMENDPFLENETDPIKSKAMDSCLWEIKSLQHHALQSIAKKAKFIDKQLPKIEKDLAETISYNYEELFKKEMGRKRKKTDILSIEFLKRELQNSEPSTDSIVTPNINCSRKKGRPCLLEPEISSILFEIK